METNKEKSGPKGRILPWRYLADSNRRTRFCRPIPSRSVKVPTATFLIAGAKITKISTLHILRT